MKRFPWDEELVVRGGVSDHVPDRDLRISRKDDPEFVTVAMPLQADALTGPDIDQLDGRRIILGESTERTPVSGVVFDMHSVSGVSVGRPEYSMVDFSHGISCQS